MNCQFVNNSVAPLHVCQTVVTGLKFNVFTRSSVSNFY